MKLTKQQAIEEHRKMWNWIADQYAKYEGRLVNNSDGQLTGVRLKAKYFAINNLPIIDNACFCCEYDADSCEGCPVQWTDYNDRPLPTCSEISRNSTSGGLYKMMVNISCKHLVDTELCEEVARKIANLKEK